MSKPILVSTLKGLKNDFDKLQAALPEEKAKVLIEYGVLKPTTRRLSAKIVTQLEEMENNRYVIFNSDDLKYTAAPDGGDSGKKDGEAAKDKKKVEFGAGSNVKLTDIEAIKAKIEQESFVIDQLKLKEHIENFIKTVTLDDESYMEGDVEIRHFGDMNAELNLLIAAGTKILDGLIYLSMKTKPEASGLFKGIHVNGVSEREIVLNIKRAKRAIQAAFILVYTQGSLPGNKGKDERKVPMFIQSKLYDGSATLTEIGEELSNTSTRKFPARVLLNVDINNLPSAVCSRCKLNIAGNRAVRYAVFSSGFQERREIVPEAGNSAETMMAAFEFNKKIQLAKEIRDFLKSMEGQWTNQLRFHPLSEKRPTVKDLTKKLTAAILFCLSDDGLDAMAAKIIADKNQGFQNDKDFFGTMTGEDRVWTVLNDPTANFSSISVDALKGMYGVGATK